MTDRAMVFAAGFGTRMMPLTKDKPKPMIEVAGKPLIDHALDLCEGAILSDVVVNLHYLPEVLEQHLHDRQNVKTIREYPKILETGGGLKQALPLLGDAPVFTLNSDAIWTGDNPLNALRAAWRPELMDALLMLIPTEAALEHSGSGDFSVSGAGTLMRRGQDAGAPYVYSGAQLIKTDGLRAIEEDAFSLNLLWDDMIAQGRLYGIVHQGGWVDVGRPEGIEVAELEMAKANDF